MSLFEKEMDFINISVLDQKNNIKHIYCFKVLIISSSLTSTLRSNERNVINNQINGRHFPVA